MKKQYEFWQQYFKVQDRKLRKRIRSKLGKRK